MENIREVLHGELNNLNSKKIIKVISGGSNGSMVVFDIGDYHVLFIYCCWRITKAERIIATYRDSNDPNKGNLVIQTKKLVNEVIESIEVSQFYDLNLKTNGGKVFQAFCDIGLENTDEFETNWILANIKTNICYTISYIGEIKSSSYDTKL